MALTAVERATAIMETWSHGVMELGAHGMGHGVMESWSHRIMEPWSDGGHGNRK